MRLSGGPYVVELAPEVGGAISGLWHSSAGVTRPLLRSAALGETDPTDMACFPLVPFCNRLRDGRFTFRGRRIELVPNRPDEPHPLHGHGWLVPWAVEQTGPDRAELRFEHGRDAWPWRYEATQTIWASVDGVAISLKVRNLDDLPMPAGLGLHPYFPAGGEVRIATDVTGVLVTDSACLATGEIIPATGDHDLSDRQIAGAGLDHGFAGWSGQLDIRSPGQTVRMTSTSNARWLQVYAPPGEAFFCAEPVTHANDAFAAQEEVWPDLGVTVLEPGQSLALSIHLAVPGA